MLSLMQIGPTTRITIHPLVLKLYLGHNPISWRSKHTVAHSSTEAEYRLVAAIAVELTWVCALLTVGVAML